MGVRDVEDEIDRLRALWRGGDAGGGEAEALAPRVLGKKASNLDYFELVQLEEVLRVCRSARSLSEAGRTLFAASRTSKSSVNDADRLRKYLTRYGLTLQAIRAA